MLYRNIRKIATGEWVDVLFTTEGASFSASADSHVAGIAAALSLNANELEAVDGDSDERTGTLIDQGSYSFLMENNLTFRRMAREEEERGVSASPQGGEKMHLTQEP